MRFSFTRILLPPLGVCVALGRAVGGLDVLVLPVGGVIELSVWLREKGILCE